MKAVLLLPLLMVALHAATMTDKDNPADLAADAASWAAAKDGQTTAPLPERMIWWKNAKFGMFMHWGVYSKCGGEWKGAANHAEWLQFTAKIPLAEYTDYARTFNPDKFNADAWVKIAKDAGMKYLVITSKHHDGVAMYDSASSAHNVVKLAGLKFDPLKQLAEACQKQGIRFCVYYSLGRDWQDPDVATGGIGKMKSGWRSNLIDYPDEAKKDFAKYFERKVKPQVRELLTNYGPIGVMWFDTPERISPAQSQELLELIHSLQPDCIVNQRIGNKLGDYGTPEQSIPAEVSTKPWETCMTMSGKWSYNKADHAWKSSDTLLRNLIDIVSKGGNYLLNVGPTGEGVIPAPAGERLETIGSWLRVNGAAIYGCGPTPFGAELGTFSKTEKNKQGKPKFLPTAEWRATSKPGKVYIHLFQWPSVKLNIPAVKGKIAKAYLLADPVRKGIKVTQTDTGVSITLPGNAPDEVVSVLCFDLAR